MSPLIQDFVTHFGEMGSKWGINRTVGQIYALLFLYDHALNADEIAEALNFSRSNVSMGVKELQSWRLVKVSYKSGDRREYFEAPRDIWEIFKILAEERRRREIEPTLSALRAGLLQSPKTVQDQYAQTRMKEMHDLIELFMTWWGDVQNLDPETLAQLMRMGTAVQKILEVTSKFPRLKK